MIYLIISKFQEINKCKKTTCQYIKTIINSVFYNNLPLMQKKSSRRQQNPNKIIFNQIK